jgi:hypothetical protein
MLQPYVALALGSNAAGHEFRLPRRPQFGEFVAARGHRIYHLPGEFFLDVMKAPEAKAAMAGGQGFAVGFNLMVPIDNENPARRGSGVNAPRSAPGTFPPFRVKSHAYPRTVVALCALSATLKAKSATAGA